MMNQPEKEFRNRLRFDGVTAVSLVAYFLEHSVYANVVLCCGVLL